MHENVGERVRALRKSVGMTQAELGNRMASRLKDTTVAKLETGRMQMSVPYLCEIAAVLGVSAGGLLSGEVAVRQVPVAEWVGGVRLTGEAYPLPVDVGPGELAVFRVGGWHLAVDLGARGLEAGQCYAVDLEGELHAVRYEERPRRFEHRPWGSDGFVMPVEGEVVGRVVRAVWG